MNNFTGFDDTALAPWYITIGIAHIILVIIPSLILGPTTTFILIPHFRKTKDSTSLFFIFISIFCTMAPTTFGLLIDVSLITNKPTFGDCSTAFTSSFVFVFLGFAHLTLIAVTALFSIMQYIIIRGYTKHPIKITILLLLVSIFVGLITGLSQFIDDPFGETVLIRGSLCRVISGNCFIIANIVTVIIGFILTLIPSVVTVILFSILTYKFVKQNTIENANVTKSVLIIMIAITISEIIFRLLPAISLFFQLAFNAAMEVTVHFTVIN